MSSRPAPIRLLTRALHVEAKAATTIKGYSGDIAYDIGYGQSTLSEVFHEKKEQEPGGKRDKILYHRPKRHVEHPAKFTPNCNAQDGPNRT